MRIELAILALTAMVSYSAAETDDTTIENKTLRVVVSADDSSVLIERPGAGFAFVKKAIFPQDVEKAEAIKAEHAIWGKGHAIHLSHPGGWTTNIAIYPNCPFVHMSRTVANETTKPYEANAFDYLNFQVDLNVEQERLQVLGTGGLHHHYSRAA